MPHINRSKPSFSDYFSKLSTPPEKSPAPPQVDTRSKTPEIPSKSAVKIPVKGSASPSVSLSSEPQFADYTVKKGDSLSKIAKNILGHTRFSNEIYDLNRNVLKNPDALRIGMTLKVPSQEKAAVEAPQGPSPRPEAAPLHNSASPPDPHFVEYKVKRGDSLSRIAKRLTGNSKNNDAIYQANKNILMNPHDLRIGSTLRIPAELHISPVKTPQPQPKAQPAAERPAPRQPAPAQPASAPAPAQPAQTAPAPVYTDHTVGRGESLSVIALRMLGDSERYMEIYEANKDVLSNPNALSPGMKLRIPNAKAVASQTQVEATSSTGPVDSSGMTSGAKELFDAMQKYQSHHRRLGNTQRTKTTQAEMREIAVELDAASKAFDVDPKLMLSLFAHESGGINPRARSHTGAGGLGQLTRIAITQVHHMSGIVRGKGARSPYREHRGNFVQNARSVGQRNNIKANIWTSTAYMKYELEDRSTRSQRSDAGRHVETALKRYGDPHVSTYANKVNAESRTLFGRSLF